MHAGRLRWQVEILQEVAGAANAYNETVRTWSVIGRVRTFKEDVSDGERIRASQIGANLTARFVVRESPVTLAITPEYRLRCDGVLYDVNARPKSPPSTRPGVWLEIAAALRPEPADEI